MKVLFVCLGNICRSPVAEAIFNHKIKEKGIITASFSDSCGTSNYNIGEAPDHRAIRNATQNGVQVQHIARQLNRQDLEDFDLILAMDRNNLDGIWRLPNAASYSQKIKLIRDFDPFGGGEVPDPYYGGEKDFQEVFEMLNRSIENLIAEIVTY
jgi:protein-tyrosine phosphatase